MIMYLTCEILKHLTGVQPEAFDNGPAALAAVQAAPDTVEMVITDMDMPKMTGAELCRQLHQISPTLNVVLSSESGYVSKSAAADMGFCASLRRPFEINELKSVLARVTPKNAGTTHNLGAPRMAAGQ